MYISDRLFSSTSNETMYSVTMTESEVALFSEFQKEFGTKSKALAVMFPGAYQAKEAAKYGYDENEYRNKRAGYALKGAFTPGVATYIKKTVEEMAKNGASKKEIRDYLEKTSGSRIAAGVGEYLTSGAGGLTTLAAQGVGIYDKIKGNRAKFAKGGNDGSMN